MTPLSTASALATSAMADMTYQFHDGAIWRWSNKMNGESFCVWLDPEIAARLLVLHAEDPATAHLADELREALLAHQNYHMDEVAA